MATEVISPWTVYWITRLDSIQSFFVIVAILSTIAAAIYTLANVIELERYPPRLGAIVAFVGLFAAGATLTPTTKQACAIYLIPKIANNESVQEVGGDLKALAREWLEELRPASKQPAGEKKP